MTMERNQKCSCITTVSAVRCVDLLLLLLKIDAMEDMEEDYAIVPLDE